MNKSFQLSRIEFPLDDCQSIGQYAHLCNAIKKEDWNLVLLNDLSKFEIKDIGFPKDYELNPEGLEIISFSNASKVDNTCIDYHFFKETEYWKLFEIVRCSE